MGPELIICSLGGVAWLMSLGLLRRLQVPASGAGTRGMAREVSIVIPARNEARNLPLLLESIAIQSQQPIEVIVVDDDSSDGTPEIASAAGARVIGPGPLPEGWRGKTWACARGADEARGRLLMFLDADCRFEPGGLEAVLRRYAGGALAVCPFHVVERPYEWGSAIFNIVMVASTVPHGLFGQCLLIDRESYQKAGGYEAVKGNILENVNFCPRIRATGGATSAMPGKGVLNFRMYAGGPREMIEGWTKGFAAGVASTAGSTVALISVWISGLIFGMVAPFVTPWGWCVYGAFALLMVAMLRRVGNFPMVAGLLYPVLLVFYLTVFIRSLGPAGKKATWKGRSLHAP
ncbi:glycosyltransferase [Luteolibacter flavescens]|uniref:Glycosyltransferase n=1 Tax=Luteolibacter flavescens TaxID=1859460 RepID=A0ABT3FR03_9BACT|nr:glycosyltransferase [Luteolibacter flavescens]MCW1886008.1 glycosyltransferase [Luteolibacter flavescens]